MTTEQIITICDTLLGNCEGSERVMSTVRYVMLDERSIRNGMDAIDPLRRFGNILRMADSRVDERHAHLINWLHTILVNMFTLEREGLIQVV